MDASKPRSIDSAFRLLASEQPPIDVAVNSAGVGGIRSSTLSYPLDNWDHVMAVNLTGVFLSMQHELISMVPREKGVVLNIASVAGTRGCPGHVAYAASKHGVVGMSRSAALEVAGKGVRVNAVCPAFTETPMVLGLVDGDPGKLDRLGKRMPAGRLAQPEEVAAALLYLSSDAAAFVNGHTFVFDGALTAM